MKGALIRAAKSFNLPTGWRVVTCRSPSLLQNEQLQFYKKITEATLIQCELRQELCKTISRSAPRQLFQASKELLILQDQLLRVDKESSKANRQTDKEFLRFAFTQVWSSLITRMVDRCRSQCDVPVFPTPYYRSIQSISKRKYVPTIGSKEAVRFLYFLSRAAHEQLVPAALVEQSLGLSLSSIPASDYLTPNETLVLVKSINILLRTIADMRESGEEENEVFGRDMDRRLENEVPLAPPSATSNGHRGDTTAIVPRCDLSSSCWSNSTATYLSEIVEGVIRGVIHRVAPSLSIEQGVPLARELVLLDIYNPKLFDKIRDCVMSCGILSIDSDTLLSIVEIWKLQGIRDRDMGVRGSFEVFHNKNATVVEKKICSLRYYDF